MVASERLFENMRNAVLAVIELAEVEGLGPELPTYAYEVFWLEPTDREGSSSGKRETREQQSPGLLREKLDSQISGHPDYQRFDTSVREFADEEGEFFPGGFGRLAGPWAETILTEYFGRVGHLGLDDGVLAQVCSEFINDVRSKTAVVRSIYWVQDLQAPSEFSLDQEVQFRPLTAVDIDTFGRISANPLSRRQTHWLNSRDWVCEIRQVTTKDTLEVINRQHDMVELISAALNLTSPGSAQLTLLDQSIDSPFVSVGRTSGGLAVRTAASGGSLTLSESDVAIARAVFGRIRQVQTESSYRHLRLAYRRLRTAASRGQQEDVLIDYVIGLESLLARDTPQLETTFRFRLRGAALLSESFGKPRRRIKRMGDLYSLRSAIVHGSADEADVSATLPFAENAFREIFLWYLDHAESLGATERILQALDEEMVAAGHHWAQAADDSEQD